jgi:zinc protease
MRMLTSLVLMSGLIVVPYLSAQNPPTPVKVTSVEGVTEYRLSNGLQVLLVPDNSKPTVTVNATYLVGSRHEGYGETGMAHLLEHMLFKGTATHNEIAGELRGKGASFNGTTSWDRTNYFETLTSSDDNLKWALEMEADRMVNSRVSRKDLDSEMTVVRNEFEAGENNPLSVLQERIMSTAYLWHGYGRSPIGSRSDIENVPIEKLQAFYRNYYQPDNAVLVVAGKFEDAKTLGWIQQYFGAIPKPSRQLIPTYTEEPVQDGKREVVLHRVGDVQGVMAMYHIPAAAHPDMAALDVLSSILSMQPTGRLYKALIETKKAVSAGAGTLDLHDPGLMLVDAIVGKDGSLADAEKIMLDVVDGVIKDPPTKEEVDRSQTRLLKNIELSMNNSQSVGLTLSGPVSSGDWRLLFSSRDELRKVTPADVARVAKQYLKPDNMTIGRFIPTAAPDRSVIPPTPDISAKLKDYKGDAAVQVGEDFDPTPSNIEARLVRATLPSGLKLVMLPKKTRGGTVTATINLRFGDEKSVAGKTAAAQIAGSLLMRGTQKHTRQQLLDEFDKIKATVNAGSNGSTGAGANISSLRAGFIPALRLAAEVLKEPSFPESDMEQIRLNNIAGLENGRNEPAQQVSTALSRHLAAQYPVGDPRYVPTLDETLANIKKVTLADAKKFYADFYGASNGELVVVGDFDPAEVQKAATELFGSWKSPGSYTRVTRNWQKLDTVNQSFDTPDKANAMLAAAMTLKIDDDDPDYFKLLIANNILGNGPKSRLFKRIRETDGLSYSVGSSYNAGTKEQFGQIIFQAIANPQNAAKVEAAFREELAKALSEGFTATEVEEAKKTFLQDNMVQMAQDGGQLSTLARYTEFGRDMTRLSETRDKVSSLTPEQVNAAFKKWVDPAAFSFFKGGDFKKAGAQ